MSTPETPIAPLIVMCHTTAMGRPPPPEAVGRKSITLPLSLWERISIYRHANRINAEADAVRRLLQAGLDAEERHAARKERK